MISADATERAALVHEIIAEMAPLPAPITDDKLLTEDLGYDSLRLLELAIALEDAFDVRVRLDPDVVVETVRDAVRLVEEVLASMERP